MNPIHNTGNVALTLQLCLMDSHYVMHYTMSSLYTVKKHYLSIKGTLFHFTRISLFTIYLEKQRSCKVRTTCNAYSTIRSENQSSLFNFFVHKMSSLFGVYYRFCAPNVCTFCVYFIFAHQMSTLFMSTLFLCPKCMYFLCLLNFCAPNVYYDNSNGKKNYIKMN